MNKIKFVAASDENEAWMRFRAKLTSSSVEDCLETCEILAMRDQCEPKCRYDVYQISVNIENVEDGYPLL